MDYFNYQYDRLYAENVPVETIAQQYGTPCYIYSRATLERHWHAFDDVLGDYPHQVCYAVKANSNLAILNLLARLGSGFDIVSQGELERVLVAGGEPQKIIFSGVGKQDFEIRRALECGVGCFNVESFAELAQINQIAQTLGQQATIALRINPNVDAGTHPYISTGRHADKFGITIAESLQIADSIKNYPQLKLQGLAFHLGSQLMSLEPYTQALANLLDLVQQFSAKGIKIQNLDIGGGLGVCYHTETPPTPAEYANTVLGFLKAADVQEPFFLTIEPGRALVANAGILVTRVLNLKPGAEHNFAIVDAGMNDLFRPALYGSWHNIIPVVPHEGERLFYDIVGPLCESGDFIGKSRELILAPGDLLAVRTAGAYGFTMSSNYNSRPRIAEVMVDDERSYCIRQREKIEDLFALEQVLPL